MMLTTDSLVCNLTICLCFFSQTIALTWGFVCLTTVSTRLVEPMAMNHTLEKLQMSDYWFELPKSLMTFISISFFAFPLFFFFYQTFGEIQDYRLCPLPERLECMAVKTGPFKMRLKILLLCFVGCQILISKLVYLTCSCGSHSHIRSTPKNPPFEIPGLSPSLMRGLGWKLADTCLPSSTTGIGGFHH